MSDSDKSEKSVLNTVKGPNGGKRAGSGRKAFEPTDREREQVRELAGLGLRFKDIAALVRNGIDEDTLTKYFSKEMAEGKGKANSAVCKSLYRKAVEDNDFAAQRWWTVSQAGWKDTSRIEHTGPDGVPLDITVKFVKSDKE